MILILVFALASPPPVAAVPSVVTEGTHMLASPPGSVVLDPVRVAGVDRYVTAVEAARRAHPGWEGVEHVVIAPGEDRHVADALTAAGLCWAYGAPLLLVESETVSDAVLQALAEIRSVSTTVVAHVVGGPSAVSDQAAAVVATTLGAEGVDRIAGVDRFDTAGLVAVRMRQAAVDRGREMPSVALFADATAGATMADAIVLSAVTVATGAPLLYVTHDALPGATLDALDVLKPRRMFVAGGTAAVSEEVRLHLGAERWAGADRYSTAVAVLEACEAKGWLDPSVVGVASTSVDALCGSVMAGTHSGGLLLTSVSRLPRSTATHLSGHAGEDCYVFGGTGVVSELVVEQLRGAPDRPSVSTSSDGTRYCGDALLAEVRTGLNTQALRVYRNGALVQERTVTPYSTVDLGRVPMVDGANRVRIEAVSGNGRTSSREVSFTNLGYPWDTYIIVDKSDFRLHFVRDGVYIKSYPVAHGRSYWPTPSRTWRIDAKYHTSPTSVYGPRKMRLFKQVRTSRGYSYAYTRYLIHGTNQPWVIGTQASHGCIRMYNSDVLELFPMVPKGTMVVTRN
jgi:putative cell wall-binding protein